MQYNVSMTKINNALTKLLYKIRDILFIHSFIHSTIHFFIYSLMYSFIYSFLYQLNNL